MTTFTDSFNRANGALASPWAMSFNTPAITGNFAGYAYEGAACVTTITDSNRLYSECHVLAGPTNFYAAGPAVKMASGGEPRYYACLEWASPTVYLRIYYRYPFNTILLASTAIGASVPSYYKLGLEYKLGHLKATFNDSVTAECDHTALNSYPYAGFNVNGGVSCIDDITIVGGASPVFAVSPSPIGNFGATVPVTFTGVGTAWTPGTPGSPTFTVDHGTLSAQTVVSATVASATYDPGTFLGIATFLDPSTGSSCQVQVTSNPVIAPPGGLADTWSPYATLVQHTGTYNSPNTLITDQTVTIPAATPWPAVDLPFLTAIQNIYAAVVMQQAIPPLNLPSMTDVMNVLNGNLPLSPDPMPTQIAAPLNYTLTNLYRLFWNPVEGVDWKIDDVMQAIQAISSPDLSQVRNELGVQTQYTYASLLAAVISLKGDLKDEADANQTQIQTELGIRDQFTYFSLLDAIKAVSVDLSPITSKLAAIQPSTSFTLSSIASQAGSAVTAATAAEAALGVLTGGGTITLGAVLEAISALADLIGGLAGHTAPVWPGQSAVSLGPSHALTNGMIVSGPLHGLLIAIAGQPEHNQRYLFGSINSWSRVGAVIFTSDRGDGERSQTFALDSQVLVPQTMEVANSATIRVNSGWTGTVRAWSRA